MISFTATIQKFEDKGEKTGWRYIEIPAALAQQLKPNNKKSFRVKGKLDDLEIEKASLLPMGEGDFILAIGADMRKKLWKGAGDTLEVKLEVDNRQIEVPEDFRDCLADEPAALAFFNQQAGSHRNYFVKWIESAKSVETRSKRIAMAVDGLARHWDYSQMIRANKKVKEE